MITTVQVPVKVTFLLFTALISSLFLLGGAVLFLGQHGWLPQFFMHVYNRIQLVGDPFSDPYGQGFQMIHSYYALFNGGLSGLGLGNSITKKGSYPLRRQTSFFGIGRGAWPFGRDFCNWIIISNCVAPVYSFGNSY